MSASSDLLRQLVPEFADDNAVTGYPDALVDVFLDAAALQHNAASFGALYQLAMIYYASHLMAVAYPLGKGSTVGAGATGGPITSKKAGDVALSFGAATGGITGGVTVEEAELMTTSYGRRYLSIRNSRSARGPRIVRGA